MGCGRRDSWWTFKVVGETLVDEPLVGEHFARLDRLSIPR
jgi:hypothetical protein